MDRGQMAKAAEWQDSALTSVMPQCYDLGVSFALLYIVLGIIAFYLVAGVLRYIRQEMQPTRDEKRKKD